MCVRRAGEPFQVFFMSLLAYMDLFFLSCLCLKAWTPSCHPQCALSAAACVAIGWKRAPLWVCSIGDSGRASRFGRVYAADTGKGCGRRHLRHNLSLTAEPSSTCGTLQESSGRVCVALLSPFEGDWHFFGTAAKKANILSFRCYFQSFSTSTFCVSLQYLSYTMNKDSHSSDEWNKTCWGLGFGKK